MSLHQFQLNRESPIMYIGYGEDGPAGVPFSPSQVGESNTPLSHAQKLNEHRLGDTIFFRINGRSPQAYVYNQEGVVIMMFTIIESGDHNENTRVRINEEVIYVEKENGDISEHYFYKGKTPYELEEEINSDSEFGLVDFYCEAYSIEQETFAQGDFYFLFGDSDSSLEIVNLDEEAAEDIPLDSSMDGIEVPVESYEFPYIERSIGFAQQLDKFLYTDEESPSGEIFSSEAEIITLCGVYADDMQDYLKKLDRFAETRIRYENKYTLIIVPVRDASVKIEGDYPNLLFVTGNIKLGDYDNTLIPQAYTIAETIFELPNDESPENKEVERTYSTHDDANVIAFSKSNGYTYIRTSRIGKHVLANAKTYTAIDSLSQIQNIRLAVHLANQIRENLENSFMVGEAYYDLSEADAIVEETMKDELEGLVYHMSSYVELNQSERELKVHLAFAPFGTLEEVTYEISSFIPEEVIAIDED